MTEAAKLYKINIAGIGVYNERLKKELKKLGSFVDETRDSSRIEAHRQRAQELNDQLNLNRIQLLLIESGLISMFHSTATLGYRDKSKIAKKHGFTDFDTYARFRESQIGELLPQLVELIQDETLKRAAREAERKGLGSQETGLSAMYLVGLSRINEGMEQIRAKKYLSRKYDKDQVSYVTEQQIAKLEPEGRHR
ncbi:MAG: hypothetical protein PHD02_03310 [Bacilli bacterium]|nr:hypothetical protein [Bacilli bacterium]